MLQSNSTSSDMKKYRKPKKPIIIYVDTHTHTHTYIIKKIKNKKQKIDLDRLHLSLEIWRWYCPDLSAYPDAISAQFFKKINSKLKFKNK